MPQPNTPPKPVTAPPFTQQGDTAVTPSTPAPALAQPKLLGGTLLYPTLAIIGCSCLTWALRRRSSTKPKAPGVNADHVATISELSSLRSDLNELGERLAQKLDRKAAQIEELLARAELASEELRRLRASTSQAGTRPAKPSSPQGDGFIEAVAPLDPLHARVAELSDQGLTPVQIAQRLEQPTGQIELILALRRRYVRSN